MTDRLLTSIRSAVKQVSSGQVIAVIALIVALGGTAYAVNKNSVGSKQVKDGSLKFKDTGFAEEIDVKLNFGQSKVVAKYGSLSLRASCLENTENQFLDPNQDVLRLVAETTKDGAVLAGDQVLNGSAPTEFLDTDTPELERIMEESAIPTGESEFEVFDETEGFVVDSQGKKSIIMGSHTQGYLIGLYGSDCIFKGSVQYLR